MKWSYRRSSPAIVTVIFFIILIRSHCEGEREGKRWRDHEGEEGGERRGEGMEEKGKKVRGEGAKDRKGDERERDKEDVGWGVGGEG